MRAFVAIAATLIAAPLAAAAPVGLAGVSDEETVIRSGQIEEFHRGHADVIFVRDRENKWYRVQLNTNCLNGNYEGESAAFRSRDVSGQINKLTEVSFPETGIRCNIDSIRRSAPPPQVDSKSPVTLD